MPKRSPAVELDLAITALLATPGGFVEAPDKGEADGARRAKSSAEVSQLLTLVRDLRAMPRPEFKAALKSKLHLRSFMSQAAAKIEKQTASFRPPNFRNIAPYFLVEDAPKFIEFLVSGLGGKETGRYLRPDGKVMHAAVAIGDSMIELGDANEQYAPRPMTVHLYVDDCDATYARALEAGATALTPLADQHWGDRWGAVKDSFGNTWYIATPKTYDPAQYGLVSVQPYMNLRGAHKMISFAEAALGAQGLGVKEGPDGKILHATVEIAGSTFELSDAQGGHEASSPFYLHVYVPDTDALYAQAVANGAKGKTPPYTAPYGERSATIEDPFGNTWFLATHLGQSEPSH